MNSSLTMDRGHEFWAPTDSDPSKLRQLLAIFSRKTYILTLEALSFGKSMKMSRKQALVETRETYQKSLTSCNTVF